MDVVLDSLHCRELLELAVRPLGALGTAAEFPQDRAGIEALIERLPEGRPSEPERFAYEDGVELPRYDGERTTWLAPAGGGALRVRREIWWALASVTVVLHPDGRVGDFEEIEGFGVPEAELTEVARADREALERHRREGEEDAEGYEERFEERQDRFRTENLIRSVAAPPGQHPAGPVVSYLVLYETGVQVNYLVPGPTAEAVNDDDPFADPHMAAMFPGMKIDDGLGTEYEVVDLDSVDANGALMRARLSFAPAIPAAASAVRIVFDSVTVHVDLGAP
jgi:hypothetical protein